MRPGVPLEIKCVVEALAAEGAQVSAKVYFIFLILFSWHSHYRLLVEQFSSNHNSAAGRNKLSGQHTVSGPNGTLSAG